VEVRQPCQVGEEGPDLVPGEPLELPSEVVGVAWSQGEAGCDVAHSETVGHYCFHPCIRKRDNLNVCFLSPSSNHTKFTSTQNKLDMHGGL
jgi:hypothetical protein